jgi:hypothetical protein
VLWLQELLHLILEAVRGLKGTKEASLSLQLDGETTKTGTKEASPNSHIYLIFYYHAQIRNCYWLAGAAALEFGGSSWTQRLKEASLSLQLDGDTTKETHFLILYFQTHIPNRHLLAGAAASELGGSWWTQRHQTGFTQPAAG